MATVENMETGFGCGTHFADLRSFLFTLNTESKAQLSFPEPTR